MLPVACKFNIQATSHNFTFNYDNSNAQVKLPSAVATAAVTQTPKSAAALAAAPTRGVASAGKKPTANKNYNGGKNASANMNATAKATKPNADMNTKSTAPFALNDVTAANSSSPMTRRPTQQLGEQHRYNAIRMQLKHAGGAAVWGASKDRPVLQATNTTLGSSRCASKR
ncbi:hypothetical protein PF008_g29985 [Phytophthora fragariae]|uniref:Uncharacterized protein n=1 Tax=Phytophthora fragariae TaxID=53985 RepID=A0A6G0Q6V6_9STRA|nr:hypothetical protein PF008_g29985 [Phytophthora fragariae]